MKKEMLSIDHYEMDSASIQALQRNMKGLKEILLLLRTESEQ